MWLVITLPTLFSVNIIPLKQRKAVGKTPMDSGSYPERRTPSRWQWRVLWPLPWVLSDSGNVLQGVFI